MIDYRLNIGQKCYPSIKNSEEAFHQLLFDNILPNALRRQPQNIAAILKNPSIEAIYQHYFECLQEIFSNFASVTDNTVKSLKLLKSTSKPLMTFDEHKLEIESSKASLGLSNDMGYNDFCKFASDFGLTQW